MDEKFKLKKMSALPYEASFVQKSDVYIERFDY